MLPETKDASTRSSGRIIAISIGAIVVILATFIISGPIPQDPNYHEFADQRSLFGIGNFWNVASNIPFLIVGAMGLVTVRKYYTTVCAPGLLPAHIVFFSGVFLTAFGSGYYHLAPDNASLVWDRLPMTVGFAGLFAVIVGEFVSPRAARHLLLPLLAVGLFSVVYWAWTEFRGAGDLRPYALVQFLPLLLILVILIVYRSNSGAGKYYWMMIGFYVAAKVFEFFDAAVFAAGHYLSGHSIKHVFAAITPAVFWYAMTRRMQTE